MTTYIAFLKGINVGPKHRVGMADLTAALKEEGYQKICTYIQSGNVLLDGDFLEAELRSDLERLMEARFGFPIPVMIRTANEVQAILDRCPYSREEIQAAEENSGVESLHICMLHVAPEVTDVEKLKAISAGGDRFVVSGREIYLLLQNGVHLSKLAERVSKLSVPVTMRNQKTMLKLAQLAQGGEK